MHKRSIALLFFLYQCTNLYLVYIHIVLCLKNQRDAHKSITFDLARFRIFQ